MKKREGFVSNSSSSSFILSKKKLTSIQLEGLSSWVNVYNNSSYGLSESITETKNYFFGRVDYLVSIKDQLLGLGIDSDKYDLED